MQANMQEDVQEAATETSGDGDDSQNEETPPPPSPGGMSDLGSKGLDGQPVHHRLAKSVNGSTQQGGR